MKLTCKFIVDNENLPKVVEFAKNSTSQYWFELLKGPMAVNLEKTDSQTKNTILVIVIAVGLLKVGFDEKEVLTILENLFESDTRYLSPGNQRIH